MGFSLIYLGEHYLIDVLAGAALAIVVAVVADRWVAGRRWRWLGHADRKHHAPSPTLAPGKRALRR